jgi:hypothetical protein
MPYFLSWKINGIRARHAMASRYHVAQGKRHAEIQTWAEKTWGLDKEKVLQAV